MCDYCYMECICPGSRADREARGEVVADLFDSAPVEVALGYRA